MSRSLYIPLIALAGIIIYGTTQAARSELPPPSAPVYAETSPTRSEPAPPVRPPPPPPPAPRLLSEVEAEAQAAAEATRDSAAIPGPLPSAPAGSAALDGGRSASNAPEL